MLCVKQTEESADKEDPGCASDEEATERVSMFFLESEGSRGLHTPQLAK